MRQDAVLRRAVQVGLVAPAFLAVAGIAVQIAALDGLSSEVVTHWGPSGPDGYGPAWVYPALTLAVGLGMPALLMAFTVPSLRRGERSPMLRVLPALAVGLSGMIVVVSTGSVLIQRDGDTGAGIVPVMAAAFLTAFTTGAVGWLVQPSQDTVVPSARSVVPVEAAPGTRIVWIGRAEMGRGPMLALVGTCVLLLGLSVWMWLLGDQAAAFIVTGVTLLVALLVSTMTAFHVRADRRGLSVRSSLGLPRFTIPAPDIAAAEVSDVSGLTQFGGWGIRMIPGATAIVLRNGPALEITRRGGRRFVVTLDDADTVAGVLTAVAEGASRADQD